MIDSSPSDSNPTPSSIRLPTLTHLLSCSSPPDPQLSTLSYPSSPLPFHLPPDLPTPGADSDSDSDLSLEEERTLSIPSSESEDNGRTRGRFQRPLHRAAQSERLLAHPKGERSWLIPWVIKGLPCLTWMWCRDLTISGTWAPFLSRFLGVLGNAGATWLMVMKSETLQSNLAPQPMASL